MKKIIEKIMQWCRNWRDNMHEARVNRLRKLAREYCKLSDLGGQPCVMIDGVPLFCVTDKETSLTDFRLNIKDSAEVINAIRISYLNEMLHDE